MARDAGRVAIRIATHRRDHIVKVTRARTRSRAGPIGRTRRTTNTGRIGTAASTRTCPHMAHRRADQRYGRGRGSTGTFARSARPIFPRQGAASAATGPLTMDAAVGSRPAIARCRIHLGLRPAGTREERRTPRTPIERRIRAWWGTGHTVSTGRTIKRKGPRPRTGRSSRAGIRGQHIVRIDDRTNIRTVKVSAAWPTRRVPRRIPAKSLRFTIDR